MIVSLSLFALSAVLFAWAALCIRHRRRCAAKATGAAVRPVQADRSPKPPRRAEPVLMLSDDDGEDPDGRLNERDGWL